MQPRKATPLKGMRAMVSPPVAALHGKEPKGAHDIGPQGREGTIADLAPDARQPDTAFPPGKPALVCPKGTAPHRQMGYRKLLRTFRGDHLDKGAALRPPGDERHHALPPLVVEIPARKTFLPAHCFDTAFLFLLYSVCPTKRPFYSAAAFGAELFPDTPPPSRTISSLVIPQ